MVPNVFVSSTIDDNKHLREAIRDTVEELSFRSVLSEFGDVGYLPQTSAENSCYSSIRDCQIVVLIIGKRYGSLSANGRTVTHNEFLTARDQGIPVICLIDREVLSYKKVFDANPEGKTVPGFPGMDSPTGTFSLIQTIMDAPVNNGVLAFGSVAESRTRLKTQLAHIFGDLLRLKFDPATVGIKDVLSEVMTLRQELRNTDMDPQLFLRATRFLLDDTNSNLLHFVEKISGSIEIAVPVLLKCRTFADYIKKTETDLVISEEQPDIQDLVKTGQFVESHLYLSSQYGDDEETAFWYILTGKRSTMNKRAKRDFNYTYEALRKACEV